MPLCHICRDDEGPRLLINKVHTCPDCLHHLIRRVVNGSLNYPVIINYEPADLTEHENHPDLDRDLLEGYAGMEQEHNTPTNLRVHCENGHWVGERVTSTVAGSTYLVAISTCDKCQGSTCMICKKHLEKDASLPIIVDHGCKATLAADRKIRQQAFEGQERGEDYQICPVCKRDVHLKSACYHIVCHCKTHFCYKCGVPAIPEDGHWDKGGVCPQYPQGVTPRPATVRAPPAPRPQARLPMRFPEDFVMDRDARPPETEAQRARRVQNQRVVDEFNARVERARAPRSNPDIRNPAIRNGPHPINAHAPFDGMPDVPREQNLGMQEAPAHREANAVRARLGGQFAVDVAERLRRRAMDEDNQVVAARDALAARPTGQAPNVPLQLPHRRALPVVGHQVGMDIQDLPATQDERQGDRVRGQQQAEFEREPLLRVPEEQVMVQAFGAAMAQLDGVRRQRQQVGRETQPEAGLEASMHASGQPGGLPRRHRQPSPPEREDDSFNEG